MTLEEYKKKIGISNTQLAHLLGVSHNTIYEWFKGRKPYKSTAELVYKRTNKQVKPEDMGWIYE